MAARMGLLWEVKRLQKRWSGALEAQNKMRARMGSHHKYWSDGEHVYIKAVLIGSEELESTIKPTAINIRFIVKEFHFIAG